MLANMLCAMNLSLNISSLIRIVTLADTDIRFRYDLVQYYYRFLFCRQFTGHRRFVLSSNMPSKLLSLFLRVFSKEIWREWISAR